MKGLRILASRLMHTAASAHELPTAATPKKSREAVGAACLEASLGRKRETGWGWVIPLAAFGCVVLIRYVP